MNSTSCDLGMANRRMNAESAESANTEHQILARPAPPEGSAANHGLRPLPPAPLVTGHSEDLYFIVK